MKEYLDSFLTIAWLLERVDVTIEGRDASPFTVDAYEVKTSQTDHSTSEYTHQIDGDLVFSRDMTASDTVARFVDGSSVRVLDCAYCDEDRTNHATPRALGRALADVDIDHLYLTHFYPNAAANTAEIRQLIADHVPASVHVPSDMDTIWIPSAGT